MIRKILTKDLYNDFERYNLTDFIEGLSSDKYSVIITEDELKELNGFRIKNVFNTTLKNLKNYKVSNDIKSAILVVKAKNDAFDMLDKASSVVSGIIKDELVYLACKEDIHLNDNYVTLITFA